MSLEHSFTPPVVDERGSSLLDALVRRRALADAVPRALAIVEHEPLASAGRFRGDLLRALMEVPGDFWSGNPSLFDRYRQVLRAGAAMRWSLSPGERDEFWSPLRTQ